MAAAAKSLSKKILVTNRRALHAKYGSAGLKAIEQAVTRLAEIDKTRGFKTTLVYLDGPAVPPSARVEDAVDPAENKAAVDAVVKKHRPEYLVLVGSHDVVPYQDLKNKLHDPADPESDPDEFAASDLPYACEAPYSQDTAKFLGPTRVVGRIPDLTGASSPSYLVARLDASAAAAPTTRPDSCFAISAKVWAASTKKSVRNILGTTPTVLLSPSAGPTFTTKQLAAKVHFVNCHGNTFDHTFAGEFPDEKYFTAMDARKLKGLGRGTVAAFECCYGAELYDPSGLPAMSIANTYLAKGASGVVASTTIAYGPPDDVANADVMCYRFIERVLGGASLGRALLEARLAYMGQQSVADPMDEKTLAQFVLLGDPSLHPFVETKASTKGLATASAHAARQQRRVRLMKTGQQLSREMSYTVATKAPQALAAMMKRKELAEVKKTFGHMRLFRVKERAGVKRALGKTLAAMPHASNVLVATRRRKSKAGSRAIKIDGLVAYQVNGQMVTQLVESR